MENQELKSFVDNHQSMKFLNEVIDNVNEAIASEEQIVAEGIRESSDNLADIDENGIDKRARVANLPGFLNVIDDNLEHLKKTRSLNDLKELKSFLELLKTKLESKLGTEYVTGQSGIENFNKLFNLSRAQDFRIPKGELIKVFVVDANNILLNGLIKAIEAYDNQEINLESLTDYVDTIRGIAQYDNFGKFQRDNMDLIMNPTSFNIGKLGMNLAFLKFSPRIIENKIIPKEKSEENKIIPKNPNEKNTKQTKPKKQQAK